MNHRVCAAAVLTAAGLACAALGVSAQPVDPRSFDGRPTQPAASPRPSGQPESTGRPGESAPGPSTVSVTMLRERSLEELSRLATNEDPRVRANVIEAMLAAPARVEPVVAAGLVDESAAVRSVAAMAVGKARLKRLVPAVEPLLKDPSPFVQASALFAKRKNDPTVNPTPLASLLLTNPSARARAHAAFVLGELGDTSARPMLRQAARDRMPRARVSEAEIRLMRLQIAEAMVKLGEDQQIETLRAALYPSTPQELEATALAVQILGQLNDRGSVDQLIFLSASKDPTGAPLPAEIRLAIAGALAQMGVREGGFIAREFVADPSPVLRSQAAFVLGEIGRPDAAATIDAMLGDPEPLVRAAAAAAGLRIDAALAADRVSPRRVGIPGGGGSGGAGGSGGR